MKNAFSFQRGDLFGGLTAGIVALPLALAFGVQSGLGAAAGLYSAIAVGMLAAIFGGTNTQISGPTGPMTVVSAAVVATMIALKGDLATAMPLIMLTFFLCGVLQIGMGMIGIGSYIRYIPYPVISGFMTGIGVIIILLQIFPSLGHVSPSKTFQVLRTIGEPLGDINWHALILSVFALMVVYLFPKINKTVPSPLIALILGSLLPIFIPMDIAVIGDIPSGLPAIHFNMFVELDDVELVILSSLTLAALGAIDSLLTSVVADNITRTQHNSRRELIGQGIGNIGASLIGGIPGAGATMRTMVNVQAGGRSKVSGIIHSLVLILILLGLSKYAAQIPLAVLSGILITVGIGIIDMRGIKHFRKIPREDAVVMTVVLLLTVFVDLLQAVAAGLIISSIWFMKQMSDITQEKSTTTLQQSEADNDRLRRAYGISERFRPLVSIKEINGPLFFGNNTFFSEVSKTIPRESRVLLIDMEDMPYMDQSGLYTLETIIIRLKQQNIEIYLLGLQDQPRALMRNTLVIPQLVEEKFIFQDKTACIQAIEEYLKETAAT